nr:MAG TPA: hypothetical protein [Caudoviricetes sp.]
MPCFQGLERAPDSTSTPGVHAWPLGFRRVWPQVAPG